MGFSPQSARSTAYGSGRHTGHHHQPASHLSSFLRKKLFRVSKQNTRPPPSSTSLPHQLEPPIPPVSRAGPAPAVKPASPRSPPVPRCSKGKMLLPRPQTKRDPGIAPLLPAPQTKPQHTTTTSLSKEDHVNARAQTVQHEGLTSHLLQEARDGGNQMQREEPQDLPVHLKFQRQHDGGGRGGEKEAGKISTRRQSSKTTVATLASEQEEKVREFKESVLFFKHQLECGYRHHIMTLEQMKSATEVLPEEQRGKALRRYAEAYAEVLTEHLRARRTPATLEQYEFIQGGSLMHYMHAKQKFPEDVVKVCIAELVLAVKEVHDRGYIHRDIKPDNIVFTRDGHLKLLDFGLAKFAPLVFQRSSPENT